MAVPWKSAGPDGWIVASVDFTLNMIRAGFRLSQLATAGSTHHRFAGVGQLADRLRFRRVRSPMMLPTPDPFTRSSSTRWQDRRPRHRANFCKGSGCAVFQGTSQRVRSPGPEIHSKARALGWNHLASCRVNSTSAPGSAYSQWAAARGLPRGLNWHASPVACWAQWTLAAPPGASRQFRASGTACRLGGGGAVENGSCLRRSWKRPEGSARQETAGT